MRTNRCNFSSQRNCCISCLCRVKVFKNDSPISDWLLKHTHRAVTYSYNDKWALRMRDEFWKPIQRWKFSLLYVLSTTFRYVKTFRHFELRILPEAVQIFVYPLNYIGSSEIIDNTGGKTEKRIPGLVLHFCYIPERNNMTTLKNCTAMQTCILCLEAWRMLSWNRTFSSRSQNE